MAEKVKAFFDRLFRYRLTAIYFLIGQLIVYVSIFGALQIYNMALEKENDRKNSICDYRYVLNVTKSKANFDILSKAGDGIKKGNLTLRGRFAFPFKESGYTTRGELILSCNEPLQYVMESGHIPGTEAADYGRNVVALGRDKYKYAYERDGKKYVTLCLEEYEVVGVIGSNSDYWDYKIVCNIGCIGDKMREYILQYNECQLHLESNIEDMQESYKSVCANIQSVDPVAAISAYKDNSKGKNTIDSTLAKQNVKVNIIVYLFCIVNCVIISYFWIFKRRKEIAIRKAFGISNIKIGLMLFKEMLCMMIFSLILFVLLFGAFSMIVGQDIGLKLDFTTVAIVAGVILITSLISIIYPVIKVFRMDAAAGVKG